MSLSIIEFIQSRRSIGNLTLPVPNKEQLQQAFACAMTAPDHKLLRPYRFIVLENDSLLQFGLALKQAAMEKGETDEMALTKVQNLPKRANMIVVCVTNLKYHVKVPKFEQILSAGAGVQNLLLALQAQGFATVWRTGLLANEKAVKRFFDVTDDNFVVGFIYVGTAGASLPEREAVDVSDFISYY